MSNAYKDAWEDLSDHLTHHSEWCTLDLHLLMLKCLEKAKAAAEPILLTEPVPIPLPKDWPKQFNPVPIIDADGVHTRTIEGNSCT